MRLEALVEATRHLMPIQSLEELRASIVKACSGLLDAAVDLHLTDDARVTSADPHVGDSGLDIPLHIGDRALGSLSIRRGEPFSDADVDLARAFAVQAVAALANSRLYAERARAFEDLAESQHQLAEAQKMDAIGRLAGGVAHDFNNLLTVIGGRSDLLLARLAPDDPSRSAVELIARAAERAALITQQLLAFSRKQILQPEVVDLNALIATAAPRLQQLAGEQVDLVLTRQDGLGRVRVDPDQIEQVLVNLALNARDAMPRGGRLMLQTANAELDSVYARAQVGIRPGPHVALVVSDTGVGMDADTKARLFEPFFTTKGPGKGSGLGLATVYGIVKQSGGSLRVYSELGLGTTFRIYFPRVEEPVAESTSRVPTADAPGLETVLLVEDDDDVRDLARDILQTHGYTVLEAGNAAAALAVAEQHRGPIHAMLTDVVMPETNGLRLAEGIALLRPETKVLYMSGHAHDADAPHGAGSLAPFLQKPFAPAELRTKIRAVLDG
jgi:signal transduction histidine kinase